MDYLLFVVCLILVLCVAFWLHHSSSKALIQQFRGLVDGLADGGATYDIKIEDLKEDLLDMVHETIGNMEPPSAIDHIAGALAGPIQMWAMRKAGIDPSTGKPIEMIRELADSVIDEIA